MSDRLTAEDMADLERNRPYPQVGRLLSYVERLREASKKMRDAWASPDGKWRSMHELAEDCNAAARVIDELLKEGQSDELGH